MYTYCVMYDIILITNTGIKEYALKKNMPCLGQTPKVSGVIWQTPPLKAPNLVNLLLFNKF